MQTRKKNSTASLQSRTSKHASFKNKPIQKVLKDYNSCYHQRLKYKKDSPAGTTSFIISINTKDYPKTLQAYNSRDSVTKYEYFSHASKQKTLEVLGWSSNKCKKIKCEGFCGKSFIRTYLKNFLDDGQNKEMCPECIERVIFR